MLDMVFWKFWAGEEALAHYVASERPKPLTVMGLFTTSCLPSTVIPVTPFGIGIWLTRAQLAYPNGCRYCTVLESSDSCARFTVLNAYKWHREREREERTKCIILVRLRCPLAVVAAAAAAAAIVPGFTKGGRGIPNNNKQANETSTV